VDGWPPVCQGESLNFWLGICRIPPYKWLRHAGERQWPKELVRPRKSLTEEPDKVSGKRPTKQSAVAASLCEAWPRPNLQTLNASPTGRRLQTKALVVYPTGFVRAVGSRRSVSARGRITRHHFTLRFYLFKRDLTSSQLDPEAGFRAKSSNSASSNAFSASLGCARPFNNSSSSSCQIRSRISWRSAGLSVGSCSKISALLMKTNVVGNVHARNAPSRSSRHRPATKLVPRLRKRSPATAGKLEQAAGQKRTCPRKPCA